MSSRFGIALVRAAVEKGLNDIKDNSKRGIRNLVDLGEMFSKGELQKGFFSLARKELQNENSRYFKLVEWVVRNFDTKYLTQIGINLGYKCWSQGAEIIRHQEEKRGFNIPWAIFLSLGCDGFITPAALRKLILEGGELGTYCYFLHIEGDYAHMQALEAILSEYKEYVFVLLLKPDMVDQTLMEQMLRDKNLVVLLDMEDEEEAFQMATQALKERGCVFGAYARYLGDENKAQALLPICENREVPFLFMVQAREDGAAMVGQQYRYIDAYRRNPKYAVIPFDLWEDMAMVDRNISSEATLMVVKADGSIDMMNMESRHIDKSRHLVDGGLAALFEQALPKNAF